MSSKTLATLLLTLGLASGCQIVSSFTGSSEEAAEQDWNAVIALASDPNDLQLAQIQGSFEEAGVIVVEARDRDEVEIKGSDGAVLAVVDVAAVTPNSRGWILVSPGRDPVFVKPQDHTVVIEHCVAFFDIDITIINVVQPRHNPRYRTYKHKKYKHKKFKHKKFKKYKKHKKHWR